MTTTAEILQKARDLISKANRWRKNVYATDARGNTIDARDEGAVCFCLQGAIMRQCDLMTEDGRVAYFRAVTAVRWLLPKGSTVTSFNDNNDHPDVLSLLDRAIKRAISAEEAA